MQAIATGLVSSLGYRCIRWVERLEKSRTYCVLNGVVQFISYKVIQKHVLCQALLTEC